MSKSVARQTPLNKESRFYTISKRLHEQVANVIQK
jgi:hypothetical protein